MKNVLILFFSLLITTGFAQRHRGNGEIKWLNISAKGGYGGTMLFNSDVSGDGNVTQAFLSPSYEFGGRFAIGYGDFVSIGVEVLSSGFGQIYSINPPNEQSYDKTQKFTSFDILPMLRYTSPYGFYFEAGPKFSTLKTASVENSVDGTFIDEDPTQDYLLNFSEKYTSIVAGLGMAIHNGDRLQVTLGLRGSYALGNFVNDESNYYVLNDGFYIPEGSHTAKTSPFTLKLMLEVNYIFGFWGDASCGRGRLMFFQ